MDLEHIADRSHRRVADSIPDDSPLKGDDGSILCPWCRQPMRVRFSTLGYIYRSDDEMAHINGVRMKCAGNGCGFRPNFDVPISQQTYEEEMELRDGEKSVQMGKSAESDEEVRERLRDLGYIVD